MRSVALDGALLEINKAYDKLAAVMAADYPPGTPISWQQNGAVLHGAVEEHCDRVRIRTDKIVSDDNRRRSVYITVYQLV